ncbi:peptide deformylase [Candidatus Uhrbacteria bacterium]|nr:peptide deformylase [Candidatus Uhrbacteria bacterium]
MKMRVLTHPNKALHEKSKIVEADQIKSETTLSLVNDLKETMIEENGVGIAAPQIGVQKQIIIIETEAGPQAFFNPTIIRHSIRKIESEEGCLSVPGVFGIVRRYRNITVQALDEQARVVTIKLGAFPAIVFQHEIDHLNGILFIEKVEKFTDHKNI